MKKETGNWTTDINALNHSLHEFLFQPRSRKMSALVQFGGHDNLFSHGGAGKYKPRWNAAELAWATCDAIAKRSNDGGRLCQGT